MRMVAAIDQVPPGSYTHHGGGTWLADPAHDQDGRPQYEEPHVLTAEVTVAAGQTSSVELSSWP